MKILHISFHQGLQNDLNSVSKKLNIQIDYEKFSDGETTSNAIYSVGHKRAQTAWNNNKEKYLKYDVIITSDTTAISRVFLQNNWTTKYNKKLIIWICNRYDYCDIASRDCNFPDEAYFEYLRESSKDANIHLISYTYYETIHAIKNRIYPKDVIKPTGILSEGIWNHEPNHSKKETFLIPLYNNDVKLIPKLKELNINHYHGRYNGPNDMNDYKGIIHIPYAWSNLALFEAWSLGCIYFIPSIPLLRKLSKDNFYWSPPFSFETIHFSEWYCPENEKMFCYFDSFDDLKNKISSIDYEEKRKYIKNKQSKNCEFSISKWKFILEN